MKAAPIPVFHEPCGCAHDNTFWVTLCAKHRGEVTKARREWDRYFKLHGWNTSAECAAELRALPSGA